MFIAIIFCQAQITEFRTRQFESFPNSKYLLSHSVSILK